MKNHSHLLALIQILSDAEIHSGQELADHFNLSRMAIHKHIAELKTWGLDIISLPAKGYKLSTKIELLNQSLIRSRLPAEQKNLLHVIPIIESTNQYMIDRIDEMQSGQICVSEYQTKGRGRRGRPWYSPFGSNLYYSMYWKFECGVGAVMGLSIVVGITVATVLRNLSNQDIRLKWPNDLYLNDKKMAGILIELISKSGDAAHVIMGFGINLQMPASSDEKITQAWENLLYTDRNNLVVELTTALNNAIIEFQKHRLTPFIERWNAIDNFINRPVRLLVGDDVLIEGVEKGISDNGAVLIEHDGIITPYIGGEISLRKMD